MTCRLTASFFETALEHVAQNVGLMMASEENQRKMEAALNRIFDCSKFNYGFCLKRWRENVQQLKVAEKMNTSQRTFCAEFL
jgi:hypothetical protein